MRCPKCRTPVNANKHFCHSCGAPLTMASQEDSLSPQSSASQEDMGWPLNTFSDHTSNTSQTQQHAGSGYGPQRLAESAPADFEGIVSALEKRSEQEFAWTIQSQNQQRSLIIWTFRVTRRDAHGYELPPPIPVEMRGHHIHGLLENGDRVKVSQSWRAGQTVSVDRVYNQTTCSWVRATWEKDYGARIVSFIGCIIFSIMAYFMLQHSPPGSISNAPPDAQAGLANFSILWQLICMLFIVGGIVGALASLFGSRRRWPR